MWVFAGGWGVGGGLDEVMDGRLGFEGERGEEGEGLVGRWKGFWEGREFEDRGGGGGLGGGGRERSWGGNPFNLLFVILFLLLPNKKDDVFPYQQLSHFVLLMMLFHLFVINSIIIHQFVHQIAEFFPVGGGYKDT